MKRLVLRVSAFTFMLVFFVAVCVLLVEALNQHQRKIDRFRAKFAYCEYVGSRIEYKQTVYQYNCNGILEETIIDLGSYDD